VLRTLMSYAQLHHDDSTATASMSVLAASDGSPPVPFFSGGRKCSAPSEVGTLGAATAGAAPPPTSRDKTITRTVGNAKILRRRDNRGRARNAGLLLFIAHSPGQCTSTMEVRPGAD